MINKKKFLFRFFVRPWFKWIAVIFFKKKYLMGRHFEPDSCQGWLWVIKGIWLQKILGFNRFIPFPCSPTARIYHYKNIFFHPDSLDNFQSPGIYFDSVYAKIYIGEGTLIGPGVKLLTANHDFENLDGYQKGQDITLGKDCWLGANVVILPGVTLGERTIVGAGAVVTKSFEHGNCILVGVPAKIIKLR